MAGDGEGIPGGYEAGEMEVMRVRPERRGGIDVPGT